MSIRRFNRNIHERSRSFPNYFRNSFFDQDDFEEPFSPLVNIRTTDRSYEIHLAVPGYDREDLQLEVENNVLTVHAREVKATEMTPDFSRRDFYKSPFERSFRLPDDVDEDAITASLDKGVLTVQIGRHDHDPKPRSRNIQID